MSEVITVQDLETLKKHEIFEAEVLTGKVGGLSIGADIDFATNQATGQVQKTMPAILRDIGFTPAAFDFTSGGTLGVNDRDKAVLWPLPGGDGAWYYWEGALPKVIPPASSPASTGGVSNGAWRPVGDITLREDLASSDPGKGVDLVYGAVKAAILAGANGSALVGFSQPALGFVLRTAEVKLRESVSVCDFLTQEQIDDAISGAKTLDCTAGVQAAINYCMENRFDLSVPYLFKITSVNVDRIVDGPENEFYFTIYSNNGGGFHVTGATTMFGTSLAFTSTPVSHLVRFHNVRFESAVRTNLAYVIDAKKFLRVTFSECGFHNIRLSRVEAPSYYQSYTLLNCFSQGWAGAFMYGDEAYDISVLGGLYQAGGGDYFMDMAKVSMGKVWTTIVSCGTAALKVNGPKGFDVSCYFELNALDIDFRTGGIPAAGVNLHGCISLVAGSGEPYKVRWGEAFGCVSRGNVFYGNGHSLQANSNVDINDHSYESLSDTGNAVANPGYREGALTGLTLRGSVTTNYSTTLINSKYTKNGNQITVQFVATLTSTGTNAADTLYIFAGLPMTNSLTGMLCGQVEVVGSTVNNGISPLYINTTAPVRAISSINTIPANTAGQSWTVRGYLTYYGTD